MYYENVVLEINVKVSKIVGHLSNVKLAYALSFQALKNLRAEDLEEEIHERRVGDWLWVFAVCSGKENFFELKLS